MTGFDNKRINFKDIGRFISSQPKSSPLVMGWSIKNKKSTHPEGWFYCDVYNEYIPVCNLKTCPKENCEHQPVRKEGQI